ncbi:MAG: tetratricopeptide repeat protein [Candidatus Brachytrichaceae bacterium NZ_4S206]
MRLPRPSPQPKPPRPSRAPSWPNGAPCSGPPRIVSARLKAIGDLQQFRDERDAALASYAQALDLFRKIGDRLGEANVYLAIGRAQREAELFERAIALYRQIGDAYSTARGQYFFALLLLERGETDRAIIRLYEIRQLWAQMRFEPGVQVVDQALNALRAR